MVILKTGIFLLGLLRVFSYDISFEFESCGFTEEIPGEVRTKVPWVAGIFVKTSASGPYKFFVTGTILGPSSILTVLGGAYGEPTVDGRKYAIPGAKQHKVAVGLSSSDLNDRDEHTQIVEVSNTIPYTKHEPENKHYHLFVFQLKTPLNLTTPYARAACVHTNSALFVGEEYADVWTSLVLAGGFVGPNNDLSASRKGLESPSILLDNNTVCEAEFTKRYGRSGGSDIYCGRLALGLRQEPLCPSYGTAAVGFSYGRWQILGILALHQGGRSWCGPSTLFFFQRAINAWQYLWDLSTTSGNLFPCGDGVSIELDQVCDQKVHCDDFRDEDPIYCRGRRPCIRAGRGFECGVYGPCLRDDVACNGTKDCPNGEDEEPKLCSLGQLGQIKCPTLDEPEGLSLICTNNNGERTSCNVLPPGTNAHYGCQNFYESTEVGFQKFVQTCSENGVWDPPLNFKCKPECGIIDASKFVPLIVGGRAISSTNTFPWHASIFKADQEPFRYICGGSLIERNILMTAAHCVIDSPGEPQIELLRVILGTNTSDYDSIVLTFSTAQIFQVVRAWIPPTYDTFTLAGDIALLQLDNDVVFDQNVRPVCYLNGLVKHQPGALGMVSGFGLTDEGEISKYLRYLNYPVVSTFECLSSLTQAPPISTFCAGYKNGTSVCQGDSGGGLVFPERINEAKRYVIKGLVSRGNGGGGKVCNPFNYAVFTQVDAYADWIIETLKSGDFLP